MYQHQLLLKIINKIHLIIFDSIDNNDAKEGFASFTEIVKNQSE